jgi:DMSO/TMAO reductase YedYZ molybdopterin-dependent catalytic subunit
MIIGRRSFLAALLLPVPPLPGGRFVRNVPLGRFDSRPAPAFQLLMGAGLDARRFTDLSTLDDGELLTRNEKFFIRTAAAARTQRATMRAIEVGGAVERPRTVSLESLSSLVKDAGTHVIECAGNSDPANFGLMSAARWDGVPLLAVLDAIRPRAGKWRIQVTGVDADTGRSRSSVPGASWIFHRDDLERTGAFLATRMNGADLPADNGSPLRLVVPGWYGCTCIKWVSRIDVVPDDAAATPQMIEFARRTHQDGQPRLAAEYAPPVIDLAAMPVRVEQWVVDGRTVYRVMGIVWGGQKPTRALSIRFRRDEPFVPVSDCPLPTSTTTWSMWSHRWRPSAPGVYRIVLRCDDPSIRSRRLDMFFYLREVRIEET